MRQQVTTGSKLVTEMDDATMERLAIAHAALVDLITAAAERPLTKDVLYEQHLGLWERVREEILALVRRASGMNAEMFRIQSLAVVQDVVGPHVLSPVR